MWLWPIWLLPIHLWPAQRWPLLNGYGRHIAGAAISITRVHKNWRAHTYADFSAHAYAHVATHVYTDVQTHVYKCLHILAHCQSQAWTAFPRTALMSIHTTGHSWMHTGVPLAY